MEEETVGPKVTRARFERNNKYEKPEVEERVVELRDDGKTWEEITEIMRLEIDEPKMSKNSAQTIYNRAMTRTVSTEKRAGKNYKDHTEALDKMQSQFIKGLGRYVNAVDKLSEQLDNAVDDGSIDAIKAYGIYLKTAPSVKSICSSVIDLMKFSNDQKEKFTILQEEQVWSESQMLDYIEKYMEKMEKEGIWRRIKPKLV